MDTNSVVKVIVVCLLLLRVIVGLHNSLIYRATRYKHSYSEGNSWPFQISQGLDTSPMICVLKLREWYTLLLLKKNTSVMWGMTRIVRRKSPWWTSSVLEELLLFSIVVPIELDNYLNHTATRVVEEKEVLSLGQLELQKP